MSRTKAEQLALLNWKGVFYQRYELDPHVTALEGANGAGKTTVLIACYLVLFPDLSRARFSSIGETSASGGDRGIWGRLGEPGQLSYAVMQIKIGPERILAGVQLERRTEPVVDPTPFIITNLPAGMKLQQMLLTQGEFESIPDLPQLREQAARLGAKLTTFTTAKEYFTTLFDMNVLPLRLSTDEERTKFNEMLHTTMSGGISKALTTGLRDFLFKEEAGLSTTVRKMQENLSACRRTRLEVETATELQREISGVYDAGLQMFAAAAHATRERAQEARKRLEDCARELKIAKDAEDTLLEKKRTTQTDLDGASEEFAIATQRETQAQDDLKVLREAREVFDKVQNFQQQLADAENAHALANEKHEEITADRESAQRDKNDADQRLTNASLGLADFNRGLDELYRNASEHRITVRALAQARSQIPEENLDPPNSTAILERLDSFRQRIAGEWNDVSRELSSADERRSEFSEVHAALNRAAGEDIAAMDAFARGQQALAKFRELDDLVSRRATLEIELQAAKKSADQQSTARKLAAELSSPERLISRSAEVSAAIEENDGKLNAERGRQAGAAEQKAREELWAAGLRKRISDLKTQAAEWQNVNARVAPLEQQFARPLRSAFEIHSLKGELVSKRDQLRDLLAETTKRVSAVTQEMTELERTTGGLPQELLGVRDALGGEFLSARYEDVPLKDAARIEAQLGPLREAIVVDDPNAAARAIARLDAAPETVWLLGGDATLEHEPHEHSAAQQIGKSVLVKGGSGWRVTRFSPAPVLGRRAREGRIKQLRDEEKAIQQNLHATAEALAALNGVLAQLDRAAQESARLEAGDPAARLDAARAELLRCEENVESFSRQEEAARLQAGCIAQRQSALMKLAPIAHLLDVADFTAQEEKLRTKLELARQAGVELNRVAAERRLLADRLEVLRRVPPSDEDVQRLKLRQMELREQQQRIEYGIQQFTFVHEHRAALEWHDAEERLEKSRRELEPALKAQLDSAQRILWEVNAALERSLADWQVTLETRAQAVSRVKELNGRLAEERAKWESYRIADASDPAISAAETAAAFAGGEVARLGGLKHKFELELAGLAPQIEQASGHREKREKECDEAANLLVPAQENWDKLQRLAEEKRVLSPVMKPRFTEAFAGQGSPNLNFEAQSAMRVLAKGLETAQDSAAVLDRVNRLNMQANRSGEDYLNVWLEIRNWLLRRMPTQIAQVDDPLEALEQLKAQLEDLGRRLKTQEGDLRGDSTDIAKSIQGQIRRAHNHIKRLSQDLENIHFGSIHGVKMTVERLDKMEPILRALQTGAVQGLLFEEELPIEAALDELFKRYGGKTTGQRLLDYREYINPCVELRRQGSALWEPAHGNRVSTGEGIGIGAAIMIVVLTMWERDANLLRPKRNQQTLRMLFLDEATRLSQDNLAVLFDLCQSLDLQLLIAAPEVATAEGNTTYTLVRRLDENNRDEVIASGRRIVRAENR